MATASSVPSIVIQTDGTTSLVQVGNNYFSYCRRRRDWPRTQIQRLPGLWRASSELDPDRRVQRPGATTWPGSRPPGYADLEHGQQRQLYLQLRPSCRAATSHWKQIETTFHQDLNGDGVIGSPSVVIQTDGTTSLVQVGNNYFLDPVGGGTGPNSNISAAGVYAWRVRRLDADRRGAEAGGYDVAWKSGHRPIHDLERRTATAITISD